MKFILIKSCPNGSTVNIHLESEVELRKHLEAMWRVTPGYSVIAVVSAPDTSDAGNKPQRQDALDDQLRDLIPLATKAGCYDAADFLRDRVERHTNVVPT